MCCETERNVARATSFGVQQANDSARRRRRRRRGRIPTKATAKTQNCTLQHRTDGNGGEQNRPQPYRKARRHDREILDRLALVVLRGLFGHEGALKADGSCPEDEAHVATLSLGITSGSAVPSWLLTYCCCTAGG